MDNESLSKQLWDAFPAPVFAVDEDVRILDCNAAAASFLSSPRPEVLRRRGGEVLHCVHAREAQGGCGRSGSCPACVVRGAVNDAVAGGQCIRRRAVMELQPGDTVEQVHLLVTALACVLNGQKLVLLVLEDIGELIGLKQSQSQLEVQVRERTAELSAQIVEREHAEIALRESEDKFRSLFELSRDAIMLLDRERFLDCNEAAVRMFGYPTKEEILGKHPAELSPATQADGQDSLTVMRARIEAVYSSGSQFFECLHQRKDGTVFAAEVLLQRIELKGQPVIQGVVRDISARKHAEAELSFKTSLLEAQSETTLDGLLVVDAHGKVILSNRRFQQLWSVPADLLASKDDEKLLAHVLEQVKSPESFLEGVRRLYANPEERSRDEIQFRDGRVLDRYSAPLVLRTGETAGRIWFFRDITENKRAQEALRQSEERFRQIAEHIDAVFWMASPDMQRFYYVSPAYKRVWGHSPESLYADPNQWNEAIPEKDRPRVLAELSKLGGVQSSISIEFPIRHADGLVRWLLGRGFVVRDGTDTITRFAGIVTDITERKAAEAKMAEIQRELLETSRQAGMAEVATSILHNVGNVLNSVNIISSLVIEKVHGSKVPGLAKAAALLNAHREDLAGFLASDPKGQRLPGYLAGLAARLEQEQAEILKDLVSLQDHVEHIKQIVAMQQDYARVAGVQEEALIEQLVEDALQLNAAALDHHQVQVAREYAPCPPVVTQKHKVLQILVNLIRNAKYALDEGRPAERRLVVRTEAADDRVRISVQDNGVGIPVENLVRVFEFGFTTRKQGHGFGLHNGALAAKELGGTLTAHSAGPGQGALFVLELPLLPKQGTS